MNRVVAELNRTLMKVYNKGNCPDALEVSLVLKRHLTRIVRKNDHILGATTPAYYGKLRFRNLPVYENGRLKSREFAWLRVFPDNEVLFTGEIARIRGVREPEPNGAADGQAS